MTAVASAPATLAEDFVIWTAAVMSWQMYLRQKIHSMRIIIIMTSFESISSKIELSGAKNQGIKQTRNHKTMHESSMDG